MRTLLLYLARREGFKNFALRFGPFRRMARRFVAGENLDDAIKAVRHINSLGMAATVDLLGEETRSMDDAGNARRDLEELLDRIHAEKVDCTVSLKLSQLGLGFGRQPAQSHLAGIVERAGAYANFVRVDMEDSRYTEATLDIVSAVHERFDNVGAVIQAYLYRSEADAARMIERGIRIRLVKGAYLESGKVAFPRKRDTDSNFLTIMRMLLTSATSPAIATHDEAIIKATLDFSRDRQVPPSHFEFQFLYGIRRDLQIRLARQGCRVRIYIPYGRQWYPYFMRRLAERPANLAFVVRTLLKDQEQLWKTE